MLQKIYHNVWYCRTAAVDHRKYNVWGNIIGGQAAKYRYMVGGIQFYTIQTHTNTQKIVYGVGVDIVLKKISQEKIAEIYKQWKIRNIPCSKSSQRYMTGVCWATCGGKRSSSFLPPQFL